MRVNLAKTRLLALLLLAIPSMAYSQSEAQRIARAQGVVARHTHWQWDGKIYSNTVKNIRYTIVQTADGPYSLRVLFAPVQGQLAASVALKIPSLGNSDYQGESDGEKTLQVSGQFDDRIQWETQMVSEGTQFMFYFVKGATLIAGSASQPMVTVAQMRIANRLRLNIPTRDKEGKPTAPRTLQFSLRGFEDILSAMRSVLIESESQL